MENCQHFQLAVHTNILQTWRPSAVTHALRLATLISSPSTIHHSWTLCHGIQQSLATFDLNSWGLSTLWHGFLMEEKLTCNFQHQSKEMLKWREERGRITATNIPSITNIGKIVNCQPMMPKANSINECKLYISITSSKDNIYNK